MANPLPRYLWRAFVWRPRGVLFAPNVALLGVFGMLGIVNPGFWLIGMGLEVVYLLSLVSNARFRALVDRGISDGEEAEDPELTAQLARLTDASRARYERLVSRAQSVLDAGRGDEHEDTIAHRGEVLGNLLGLALGLLERKDALVTLLRQAPHDLDQTLSDLTDRLADPGLGDELRRSLTAQRDVVAERAAALRSASERIEAIDSELGRIEQQAELLREQTVLDADPARVTERIDALTGTLRSTRDWLQEQRKLDGLVEQREPTAPRLRRQRQSQ